MEKFYINIGRQLGSGGLTIAKKLSEKFNISLYDKELLDIAAKESGIAPEFFNNADEKPSYYLHSNSFLNGFTTYFTELTSNLPLDSCELFRIQGETIKSLADKSSAIFVGRCADYILRDRKRCLNVFISCSDINQRIDRVRCRGLIKAEDVTDKDIISFIEKGDKKRSQYYNYYTYKEWGHASSYNICLDSSYLGIDECVNIISEVIKEKFGVE